ncbi:FPP/GGPP synthase family protein [Aspergillus fijiensis CBS 313.89]|uniref:Putative farnesyl pyrophosphate protein n=1 Tax=Aspergillus fijiensis CBS 313.89 TaxID=1448319 RepID=A0A8G1RDT4_9EURO|nr:putative farnesyl pyrophosphate protein [Aspergillus fijiensis CBS 313.89]RAK71069.1 putative farnesyl pyrophosphate protein [Aspergillus fijiensis CBS 313.89]
MSDFQSYLPALVQDLCEYATAMGLGPELVESYRKAIEYNTTGGNCRRGKFVASTSSILVDRELFTTEALHANVVGWCVELLQAYFLITDDLIDGSSMRRGKPCWYTLEGVGQLATMHASLLHSGIFVLLQKYLGRNLGMYQSLANLFHAATFQTAAGQISDTVAAAERQKGLLTHTMDRYRTITHTKTAYYTFFLPIALALTLHGRDSPENLAACMRLVTPMGELYQAQDDYFDNYSSLAILGKDGTDIREGKCSWLIVTALLKGDTAQRAVLEREYGLADMVAEARVKTVYDQLELPREFEDYRSRLIGRIEHLIGALSEEGGLKRRVFENCLETIQDRSK